MVQNDFAQSGTGQPTEVVLNPDGSLPVEVTGVASNTSVQRVSAGFMAPGQTAKQATGNLSVNAVSATTPINTVTAGKTFYITDISFTTDSTTAIDVQIQAAGVVIFETHVLSTAPCVAVGIETQPFGTSGQAVRIFVSNSSSGKSLNYFVGGFEQ